VRSALLFPLWGNSICLFCSSLVCLWLSCFFALSHYPICSICVYIAGINHANCSAEQIKYSTRTRFALNNFQTGVREMGNAKKETTRSVEVVDAVAAALPFLCPCVDTRLRQARRDYDDARQKSETQLFCSHAGDNVLCTAAHFPPCARRGIKYSTLH
jgi:hypothetical protein